MKTILYVVNTTARAAGDSMKFVIGVGIGGLGFRIGLFYFLNCFSSMQRLRVKRNVPDSDSDNQFHGMSQLRTLIEIEIVFIVIWWRKYKILIYSRYPHTHTAPATNYTMELSSWAWWESSSFVWPFHSLTTFFIAVDINTATSIIHSIICCSFFFFSLKCTYEVCPHLLFSEQILTSHEMRQLRFASRTGLVYTFFFFCNYIFFSKTVGLVATRS